MAALVANVPEDALKDPTPCADTPGSETCSTTSGASRWRSAPPREGHFTRKRCALGRRRGAARRLAHEHPAAGRAGDGRRVAGADSAWTGMTKAGGIDIPGEIGGLIARRARRARLGPRGEDRPAVRVRHRVARRRARVRCPARRAGRAEPRDFSVLRLPSPTARRSWTASWTHRSRTGLVGLARRATRVDVRPVEDGQLRLAFSAHVRRELGDELAVVHRPRCKSVAART